MSQITDEQVERAMEAYLELGRGILSHPMAMRKALEAALSTPAVCDAHNAALASNEVDIERLRTALEPFADFADYLASETEGFADYDELRLLPDESDFELFRLKIEAFRNARAALSGSLGSYGKRYA